MPQGEAEVLKNENTELKDLNDEPKAEDKEVKDEVDMLTNEVDALRERITALLDYQTLGIRARLRITLEAAHRELTVDLQREPGGDSTWRDFIQSITPTEKASLLQKVSAKALDLMATDKRRLNQVVYTFDIRGIAIGVLSVQDKQEAWIDIFKYAYKEDPKEFLLGDM